MKFVETPLSGLFVIDLEPITDERGGFARSFCAKEFAIRGLDATVAQCNISFNRKAGTLRGLHYQNAPHDEAKLVRCTRGAIFDVAVDFRAASPTYLRWYALELTPDNHRMLFIPRGFAHGFQTLVDKSDVMYLMSDFYHAESGRGLRWDDPAIGIAWPHAHPIISDRDRLYPLLDPSQK